LHANPVSTDPNPDTDNDADAYSHADTNLWNGAYRFNQHEFSTRIY
jgi:hypothetical protein